ncbi:MAG: hypothetical protein MR902_04785 [Campylobacter sp.]|nr:hypothetical protein [Campylobacter sp.]
MRKILVVLWILSGILQADFKSDDETSKFQSEFYGGEIYATPEINEMLDKFVKFDENLTNKDIQNFIREFMSAYKIDMKLNCGMLDKFESSQIYTAQDLQNAIKNGEITTALKIIKNNPNLAYQKLGDDGPAFCLMSDYGANESMLLKDALICVGDEKALEFGYLANLMLFLDEISDEKVAKFMDEILKDGGEICNYKDMNLINYAIQTKKFKSLEVLLKHGIKPLPSVGRDLWFGLAMFASDNGFLISNRKNLNKTKLENFKNSTKYLEFKANLFTLSQMLLNHGLEVKNLDLLYITFEILGDENAKNKLINLGFDEKDATIDFNKFR